MAPSQADVSLVCWQANITHLWSCSALSCHGLHGTTHVQQTQRMLPPLMVKNITYTVCSHPQVRLCCVTTSPVTFQHGLWTVKLPSTGIKLRNAPKVHFDCQSNKCPSWLFRLSMLFLLLIFMAGRGLREYPLVRQERLSPPDW